MRAVVDRNLVTLTFVAAAVVLALLLAVLVP